MVGVRQDGAKYHLLSLGRRGQSQPLATVEYTVWPELATGVSQQTINQLNHALLAFGVAVERIYHEAQKGPHGPRTAAAE
jgi:hypothetical protein